MRRVFWLGVGATIGVLVVRKVTKTAEAFTPAGLAASLGGLGEVLRDFADDVRAAMDEHERELLDALGVDADGAGTDSTSARSTAGGKHSVSSTHPRPSGAAPTGGSTTHRRT